MQLFEIINEVAVVGITFFMMAVSTVWYSSVLFGKFVFKNERVHDTQKMFVMLALTAVSYAVALALIAYVIAFAPVFMVTALTMAVLIAVFASALFAPLMIFESKTLTEYLVHVGFIILFVIGGSILLQYWPW